MTFLRAYNSCKRATCCSFMITTKAGKLQEDVSALIFPSSNTFVICHSTYTLLKGSVICTKIGQWRIMNQPHRMLHVIPWVVQTHLFINQGFSLYIREKEPPFVVLLDLSENARWHEFLRIDLFNIQSDKTYSRTIEEELEVSLYVLLFLCNL